MYDYYESVKDDIRNYINDEIDLENDYSDGEGYLYSEELERDLGDRLLIDDSVTGNASGSYTFNSYQAMEYVMDNMDLVREYGEEFGDTERMKKCLLNEEWETIDVCIRCYVLSSCISEVMGEVREEWEERGEEYIA